MPLRPRLHLVLLGVVVGCTTTPTPPACGKADVGGRAMYYCLRGRGDVTVVLESDAGADHTAWDSVALRIARVARVLTYDRLGLGQSDTAITRRTPDNIAGELDQLLRAVSVGEPLVLVGHGRGGWYLRSLAARRTSGVRRLILVDSPHERFEAQLRAVLSPEQRARLDSAVAKQRATLSRGARRELEDLADAEPESAIEAPVTIIRASRPDLPIRAPRADSLWRALNEELRATFTTARVIEGGPVIRLTRPDTLIAVVAAEVPKRPGLVDWWGTLPDWVKWVLVGIASGFIYLVPPWIVKWIGRRRAERTISRDPDKVLLWDLIPRGTKARGQAVALVKAINRGAVERASSRLGEARPKADDEKDSKAARIWDKLFVDPVYGTDFWALLRGYIVPGCKIRDERGEWLPERDGIAVIRRWLEAYHANARADRDCRIWLVAPGGTGKTTFLHRLFLELIGAAGAKGTRATPVPMLASANNLRSDTGQMDALRSASSENKLRTFITGWLHNRLIVPDDVLKPLVDDFEGALKTGEMVLLLDGFDELAHLKLGEFANRVTEQVRCWVVSNRLDTMAPDTGRDRYVRLNDAWKKEEIFDHLRKRWPGRSAECETVATVLEDVFQRHEKAAEDDLIAQGSHWLSQPRNLDFYLGALDPETLPDVAELRRRAESQPYLFDQIVSRAIRRLADSVNLAELHRRMFEIAITDPMDPGRRVRGHVDMPDDATWRQIRAMGELIGWSGGRPYFQHAALREYFIAGRIALELCDVFREAEADDELKQFPNEVWGAVKRTAIAEWMTATWIRDLSTGRGGPAGRVRARLRARAQRGANEDCPAPNMLRNLLDLLVTLELKEHRGRLDPKGDRLITLSNLDLSGIAGDLLDLRLVHVEQCSFEGALLSGAELTRGHFENCDFRNAELVGAELTEGRFLSCNFSHARLVEADAVVATFRTCQFDEAEVHGMAIEDDTFSDDARQSAAIAEELAKRGAILKRSRYRTEFGRKFFAAQQVFLGDALDTLETEVYLPSIEAAVQAASRRPLDGRLTNAVYLIDLMAGGSYQRIAELAGKYDELHILGVDRDPSAQESGTPKPERLKWEQFEIGGDGANGEGAAGNGELSLPLGAMLEKAFGSGAGQADVVVGKKALHELDRRLQPALIRRCAESLRPGGRLILFVDAPGPFDGSLDARRLAEMHAELDSLRAILRDPTVEPATVAGELERRRYENTPIDQMAFANTWIMLKDWANLNRHEVRHRYFASVPEIRAWARDAAMVESSAGRGDDCGYYRLNPLVFNELGIGRALYHLVRRRGDPERDRARLARWMAGSARFRVLVEFTKAKLEQAPHLADALRMRYEDVKLEKIDTTLEPLDTGEKAPSFDMRCAVLVFEKR